MSDDLRKKWSRVKDPRRALAEIVEHEDFLGYDPYFAELRASLLDMAQRCSAAPTPAGTPEGEAASEILHEADMLLQGQISAKLKLPRKAYYRLVKIITLDLPNALRTLPPSASKPVTVEEIARIINPGAWHSFDGYHNPTPAIENSITRPSLERATIILSLINARTSGVE